MKIALFGIAAVLALASPPSAAAPNNFKKSDRDRDGALSRVEACSGRTPHICRNFDWIDSNRDGVVTRAEVKMFNKKKRIVRSLPPRP